MPETDLVELIPSLLAGAWLLPLGAFGILLFFAPWLDRRGRAAGWLATASIAGSFVCSLLALGLWVRQHSLQPAPSHTVVGIRGESLAASIDEASFGASPPVYQTGAVAASRPSSFLGSAGSLLPGGGSHPESRPLKSASRGRPLPDTDSLPAPMVGQWFTWAEFGPYRLSIGYYIDTLTLLMCTMVSLVALCIHIYSVGYMAEELHEVVDREVLDSAGCPVRRPGRFGRFFQYLSLFAFSMLGLVLAGHLVMVFVFWELVGLCSYFLIGFYRERPSAQAAALKAFVVNRVGDFGFLVGLMALGGLVGTWSFGDGPDGSGQWVPGLLTQLQQGLAAQEADAGSPMSRPLWILAALGIFCGCVGKSAQFPLHVWLPDAMEGPTPVSALIHAATMVAAGVYLVGRFYPAFPAEVLVVIACIGSITLVIGATIALVATDIKRVLAYSTISQLGYMMLGLGVGGWVAGLWHLLTHAFFKALLFLGAGSVIHAVGTNQMPRMGGLARKMPWTAASMLVGCLAIAGAGIPGLIGLSGFYSKEAILAQAYSFWQQNAGLGLWLFGSALAGAALTAFYMFRLWYMTFTGPPKEEPIYHHAHESPTMMLWPLGVLSLLAITAGWTLPGTGISLAHLLEHGRPGEHGRLLLPAEQVLWTEAEATSASYSPVFPTEENPSSGTVLSGEADGSGRRQPTGSVWTVAIPPEHLSHDPAVAGPVGWLAFAAILGGFGLASLMYARPMIEPTKISETFYPIYAFLQKKWYFDEFYDWLFVRPVLWLAHRTVDIDRQVLDRLAEGLAGGVVRLAWLDDRLDRRWVDGLVNQLAEAAYSLGLQLRRLQTGRVRQYVLWIVLGTVGIFVLCSLWR